MTEEDGVEDSEAEIVVDEVVASEVGGEGLRLKGRLIRC